MNDKVMFEFECKRHGKYQSDNERFGVFAVKHCPSCLSEAKEFELKEQVKRKEEYRIAGIKSRTDKSGIPERFLTKTLETYEAKIEGQSTAYQFCKTYAEDFADVKKIGRCAIFCGKPGTGKTHLAIAIALYVINQGAWVGFSTVQKLMRRLKDTMRKDSEESESDVINRYVDVDLLILDEIGVQFGSEYEKNSLFDILNSRYENRLPTILISNLSANEVKAFIGERVFDRMREDGGVCVPFDWESQRGK
jgi:DNA replication protein DnaC